jgi:hypothetical protein
MIRQIRMLALGAAVLMAGCGGEAIPAPVIPPGGLPKMVSFQSPYCGCCGEWVDHVRAAGFEVEVHKVETMTQVKMEAGIPQLMGSCHTAMVDGYVVEGHVPADLIIRMLNERPDVKGILVPGMPAGSPGMEFAGKEPYRVLLLNHDNSTRVYANR